MTIRNISRCAFVGLAVLYNGPSPIGAPLLDFPLAPGVRWTYQLHQELGQGVSFGPEDAKLAKGNQLDTTVVSEVAGPDKIGTQSYVRLNSKKGDKDWMSEWYRLDDQGLFVARRVEEGQVTDLNPPQKVLSVDLKAGEKWNWKASDAPVVMRTTVVGDESVTVPAGAFQAVKVSTETRIQGQVPIVVRQDRWFVRGVGYVKQDTRTTAGPRMINHVVLTLEKIERAR